MQIERVAGCQREGSSTLKKASTLPLRIRWKPDYLRREVAMRVSLLCWYSMLASIAENEGSGSA
jgi:hypothetical protein